MEEADNQKWHHRYSRSTLGDRAVKYAPINRCLDLMGIAGAVFLEIISRKNIQHRKQSQWHFAECRSVRNIATKGKCELSGVWRVFSLWERHYSNLACFGCFPITLNFLSPSTSLRNTTLVVSQQPDIETHLHVWFPPWCYDCGTLT